MLQVVWAAGVFRDTMYLVAHMDKVEMVLQTLAGVAGVERAAMEVILEQEVLGWS